jgi:DNA replication protein DnaC
LGNVPTTGRGRRSLRYENSIALTSNIHPAGFDELMPKTLAAATVDRLLHHAHVLN